MCTRSAARWGSIKVFLVSPSLGRLTVACGWLEDGPVLRAGGPRSLSFLRVTRSITAVKDAGVLHPPSPAGGMLLTGHSATRMLRLFHKGLFMY